jgi:hypothetical protein
MRDPHVVSLRYRLETDKTVTFENPPSIERETNEFVAQLENGILTFRMKEHYPSVKAAREVVDKFLRAWELDVALPFGIGEMWFVYEDAHLIDRDPPPPGSPKVVSEPVTINMVLELSATDHLIRHKYPEPPERFRISPDVETLWHRYEGYLDGQEPLLSMAYFCLTLLEARAGSRGNAASKYAIEIDVLGKLGEPTSTRGDEKIARKANPLDNLKNEEKTWINAAIKMVIRRIGEYEYDPTASLPMIKMADLPPLY